MAIPHYYPVKVLTQFIFLSLLCFYSPFNLSAQEHAGSLMLSEEEQLWITEHPVVTIALDEENPPMNYRSTDGSYIGITVDYLKLIADKSGLVVKLWGGSWKDALQGALDHKYDGIANASVKEERKKFLNFTDSYFETPVAFAVRKDFLPVNDIQDFNGLKIATVQNSSRVTLLNKKCPDSQIVEVNNIRTGMKLLSENHVDVFADDLPVIQHLIETMFLTNLKISFLYYSSEGLSHIGVRNDNPILISIFNKAINSIKPAEHQKIRDKWFAFKDKTAEQHELNLTNDEIKWLKNKGKIRVGIDPAWEPIEFRDNKGKYQGIAVEYLQELEKRLNIQFEYLSASWQELVKMGKRGEVDLFSSMAETSDRKKTYFFSDTYLNLPMVVFSKDSNVFISDFSRLREHSIVVIEGYAVSDWLSEDYPEFNINYVPTISEALKSLRSGQYDYYVGGLITTGSYMKKFGYTDIKVAGDSPYSFENKMAIHRSNPELQSIINKTLSNIPGYRRNEIYNNWISIKYDTGIDPLLILQIAAVLIFIIFLILYWNYRLSREVKKRSGEIKISEERLRDLYENLPVGIFRADAEGCFITCNPELINIFNYKNEEDFFNIRIEDLFLNKGDYSKILFDSGKVHLQEVLLKNKEGSSFFGEIHLSRKIDALTEQVYFDGIVTDISSRKEMEAEIERENKLIDSLLDNLPGIFYLYDIKGHLQRWNVMFEKLLGYSKEELKRKYITEFFNDTETIEFIQTSFARVLTEGFIEIEVDQMVKKDGTTISILFKAAKMEIDGESYVVGFGIDISDKIKAEKDKEKLEKQLLHAQKLEAVGTLAGGIAHDFNNILGAILGYTELSIKKCSDDNSIQNYLDQIHKAGNRARSLVKQILLFSRQGDEEMSAFHISRIIYEVVDMMKAALPSSITIETKINTTNDLVYCDTTQIHQVLVNLITNSASAMEEDNGILTVSLDLFDSGIETIDRNSSSDTGKCLRLQVIDTGCGMTKSIQDKVFDPFFSTKQKGKGTGLGLSVVHGIIENHGGKIKVYSEPGRGTKFSIYLPLLNEEDEVDEGVSVPLKGGREHILYVDDEQILCELMESLLEELGYKATVMGNSDKALEYFKENHSLFDLVITDKTMPGLSGFELAAEIIKFKPDMPVVICTGYADTEFYQRAKDIGIKDVLHKPVTTKDLSDMINKVVN